MAALNQVFYTGIDNVLSEAANLANLPGQNKEHLR